MISASTRFLARASIPVLAVFAMFAAFNVQAAGDGKAVFDKSCAGCHNAMSPKLSEKDKWAAIMKKGEPAMIASVLKGKGAMPPRGGAPSDDDARAAVKYLETLVK